MSPQSFEEKNLQDFEDITERLNEALLKMASDPTIKATASKLAELSGVHRNTIRNREWPIERISALKAQRKYEAERKESIVQKPSDKEVLTFRLEQSRLEVLHWFNKFNHERSTGESLTESVKLLSKSRDKIKQEVEDLEQQLHSLRKDYQRVCDLLNMVKESLMKGFGLKIKGPELDA